MLKRWKALSIGSITIHWISIWRTKCAIQWIEIYPMLSVIHLLNNWGLVDNVICLLNNWCQCDKDDGTRRSLEIEFTKGSVANRTTKFTFSLFRVLLHFHLMLRLCQDLEL